MRATVGPRGRRVVLADRATPTYAPDPAYPKRRVFMCGVCLTTWTANTRLLQHRQSSDPHRCACGAQSVWLDRGGADGCEAEGRPYRGDFVVRPGEGACWRCGAEGEA